ncbi:L-lactate dehydrogenase, partial [Bacillus sp. ZZQ-131]
MDEKTGENRFARFIFLYVNKYIINIFPVVTNMTKMEYNNSQKGQTLCSIFHKVSMVSIVRTSIIKSVKNKRNRLYDH